MASMKAEWHPAPEIVDLHPHQVDVWRIHLDLPPATVRQLESTLSAEETQRAAHFRFAKDRDHYTVAHGSLRNILARYINRNPSQLYFSANKYGKPVFEDRNLEFNLSHSGDFALIAVSQGCKVGVDIERIRSGMEHEKIARRFFSPNEVAELMAMPPDQKIDGFFNCWTRKEAYIKAQGLGLSLPLDSFDVSLSPNKLATLYATRPNPDETTQWTLVSLKVESGYSGALAVKGKELNVRLWNWDWKAIIP